MWQPAMQREARNEQCLASDNMAELSSSTHACMERTCRRWQWENRLLKSEREAHKQPEKRREGKKIGTPIHRSTFNAHKVLL